MARPRLVNQLSFQKVKALKPETKAYLEGDGNGLYILVQPNGSKLWWFRYSFPGVLSADTKRGKKGDPAMLKRTLSLGQFPRVSIELARELSKEAHEKLARGIDPNEAKKMAKLALQNPATPLDNSLRAIANEWLARKKPKVSEDYYRMVEQRLNAYVFPYLGNMDIKDITPQILYDCLSAHESKGVLETINRTNKYMSEIFRYGMRRPAGKVCDGDPADLIHEDLKKPTKRSYPTIAGKRDDSFQKLLGDIEEYDGRIVTKYAMKILAHTFVRTTPLIKGEWTELDFQQKEWLIPAEKMKGEKGKKRPLLVPLSRQVLAMLKELKKLSGDGKYVFPHRNDITEHASENLILRALERMGWHGLMSGHGFRHIASTVLNEKKSEWSLHQDWIEMQLAHAEMRGSRGHYNFAEYLPERRKMMQRWSDYLDELTEKEMARRKK